MFGKSWAEIFGKGISALSEDVSSEASKVGIIFSKIAGYPVKVFASFLAAPFLIIRMALIVKNPLRRFIAVIGLFGATAGAYAAATFLGTLVGATFVASKIGILAGIGFIFGTTLSVYLSAIFSIIVLNAISFVFLKMNTQDVVDYLQKISS